MQCAVLGHICLLGMRQIMLRGSILLTFILLMLQTASYLKKGLFSRLFMIFEMQTERPKQMMNYCSKDPKTHKRNNTEYLLHLIQLTKCTYYFFGIFSSLMKVVLKTRSISITSVT